MVQAPSYVFEESCHIEDQLEQVLTDRKVVAVLARQLVASHLEMMVDASEDTFASFDNISFVGISNSLQSSKVAVEDYVSDLLAELRYNLLEEIHATKIEVRSLTITSKGLRDAEIVVS